MVWNNPTCWKVHTYHKSIEDCLEKMSWSLDQTQHIWKHTRESGKNRGRWYTERSGWQDYTSLYHTLGKLYNQPSKGRFCHFWNDFGIRIKVQEYYFGDKFYVNCQLDPTDSYSSSKYMQSAGYTERSHLPNSRFQMYRYLYGSKLGGWCSVQTQSQNTCSEIYSRC